MEQVIAEASSSEKCGIQVSLLRLELKIRYKAKVYTSLQAQAINALSSCSESEQCKGYYRLPTAQYLHRHAFL